MPPWLFLFNRPLNVIFCLPVTASILNEYCSGVNFLCSSIARSPKSFQNIETHRLIIQTKFLSWWFLYPKVFFLFLSYRGCRLGYNPYTFASEFFHFAIQWRIKMIKIAIFFVEYFKVAILTMLPISQRSLSARANLMNCLGWIIFTILSFNLQDKSRQPKPEFSFIQEAVQHFVDTPYMLVLHVVIFLSVFPGCPLIPNVTSSRVLLACF